MALTSLKQVTLRAAAAPISALDDDAVDALHDGGRVHRSYSLGSPVGASSPQQFVHLAQGFSVAAETYKQLHLALANLSDVLGGRHAGRHRHLRQARWRGGRSHRQADDRSHLYRGNVADRHR